MDAKLIVAALLVIVLIGAVTSSPIASRKEQELRQQFVEFLKQDKEFQALLKDGKFAENQDGFLTRTKRQSGNEFPDGDAETEEPPKKEGFFDRAAKFVMEVLQRFLKWINTDD